jgi:MraZ protein
MANSLAISKLSISGVKWLNLSTKWVIVVKCGKIFYIFALYHFKIILLNTIVGTYECKVDAKGRLLLPAPLKKQLTLSLQDGFVLKRSVFQPCLELYPMEEWNLMMQKINKLNRFVKKNNDFIRRFTAGVKMVEIDALGRLLIPKDLVAFSNITKEVVFSSAVNIVEIWDKDLYEKSINGEDIDFADLAEDVMGNLNDDDNGIS